MVGSRDAPSNDVPVNSIDAVSLLEALLGRKLDKRAMASDSNTDISSNYDDFVELGRSNDSESSDPKPDDAPKNLNIGCINPYALVEALIGRSVDRCSVSASKIIADVLATDYEELFDMRHDSVLYAGLELKRGSKDSNDSKDEDRNRDRAELVARKDIRILTEHDLETPDFSRVERVGDIEHIGISDILKAEVTMARMQNGKLRLVLRAPGRLGRTVSNRDVTLTLNELCLPYRRHEKENDGGNRRGEWTPSNSSWRDIATLPLCVAKRLLMMTGSLGGLGGGLINNISREQLLLGAGAAGGARAACTQQSHQFDDPVQGALGNSWFVAALFSVFWADPSAINRCTRVGSSVGGGRHCGERDEEDSGGERDKERRTFKVKFHDKGGKNNAKTATVEVDYRIPVNNSGGQPVYCRASDGCEPWPALYEKAFAKWISQGSHYGDEGNDSQKNSQRPDLTLLYAGDPVKAMAQINGRRPEYFFTEQRSGRELVGLVRCASVNHRTINPMCAFTHPTGHMYRGSNLVANHAYSVLGWAELGQRQHIIVRNPWGITEQPGLTSYPGIQDRVEPEFWGPAAVLDKGGVLAVEANAFKEYFACVGIVKREKGENEA